MQLWSVRQTARRRGLLRRVALAFAVALAWGLGCGKEKPAPPSGGTPGSQSGADEVWVRHILIQYAGARGAPKTIQRTRARADSLARAIRGRLDKGEPFAALARQYSDDPSGADGGEVAPLQPGDAPPEFTQAASAIRPGELSAVLETPYGFHIIYRRSHDKVAVQHILIRYAGAKECPDSIVRGRAEALALAQQILAEVRNPDTIFPAAAAAYSEDERTAGAGGYLGEFLRGTKDPTLEAAAFALQEGEISGVVETAVGFHIIRRVKPMTIRVSQILITHEGSQGVDGASRRTREEALRRAADVLFRARKGEDFAALAREYSEDPGTRARGGRMSRIDRGQMEPAFEEAAFSLQPGQVSDIVETEFGFHVIRRIY